MGDRQREARRASYSSVVKAPLFQSQGSEREDSGSLDWVYVCLVKPAWVTDRESATGGSCCVLWTWGRAPSQWETPTTQQGDLGDKALPHLHWVEMWYTSPVACYSFFLGHCSTYRRKWQGEPLTFQVSIFKSVYAGKALCFIATTLTWLTRNLNVPAARLQYKVNMFPVWKECTE